MILSIRRWAVIVLLALLPATLLAQACELGCSLARMSARMHASMSEQAHQVMPNCDHEMPVASDADDVCPMAALCDFAHLTALPSVHSFDAVTAASTMGVQSSYASFTSTSFPPAQRPPAA